MEIPYEKMEHILKILGDMDEEEIDLNTLN